MLSIILSFLQYITGCGDCGSGGSEAVNRDFGVVQVVVVVEL
jgi:hypothetical protein